MNRPPPCSLRPCVGRAPNGKKMAAEKADVAVTDRGFINVDIQMRTTLQATAWR